MNEEEKDRFKLFVESKLNIFHHELSNLGQDEEAGFVIDYILSEYHIIPKRKDQPYYMVVQGDCNPECDDCFNAFGFCGTPCVSCEKKESFDSTYNLLLYIPGKFMIYERKPEIY